MTGQHVFDAWQAWQAQRRLTAKLLERAPAGAATARVKPAALRLAELKCGLDFEAFVEACRDRRDLGGLR